MANIPGAGNVSPSVLTSVETLSRGVSIPSGTRLSLLMGEGNRQERIVLNALGNGNDGLNPNYTSASGSDGRHFIVGNNGQIDVGPLVPNRVRLFKNGIPLTVLEAPINSNPFDSIFDARVDVSTGRIELQSAHLVDQNGSTYSSGASNVGDGTISNLTLLDNNAPTETWTIRCSSVRRDSGGNPIDGYAKFFARGSVSGVLLDGYGQNVVWTSDGVSNSNGVLQFSISEGGTPFLEGDTFVVKVASGVLLAGDTLAATYKAVFDINNPRLFTDGNTFTFYNGGPTSENLLAVGAQLEFANGTPGFYAMQTAPAVPRRISYSLETSATGDDDPDDLQWALPLNVVPDVDSNINFFIGDPVTGLETQILPNKFPFYTVANPATWMADPANAYSYTVVLDDAVVKSGADGELTILTSTTAQFKSSSVSFGLADLSNRSLRIYNALDPDNNGVFDITGVVQDPMSSNGVLNISRSSGTFGASETELEFEVLDSTAQSARVLFTEDLALTLGQTLRATVVDAKDAEFFDAGWVNAYEAAEKIDIDMVVPLPTQTVSAIFTGGKAHVESMSNIRNRRERILLIGALKGLTPDNVLGNSLAAVEDIGILEGIQGDEVSEILAGDIEDLGNYDVQDSFGDSFRVVYFYPDEIVVQVGGDRVVLPGYMIAAAAAGYFSANPNINVPLTNKTLGGFSIPNTKLYPPLVIDTLSSSGITLLQPVQGGGRVVWGKTTTISGFPEEEEISIIFIRDRIAKDLRVAFEGFIGTAETPTFQQTLFARATSVMQSFLSRRLITDYRDLSVMRDATEPRQWNISVGVQPVYPVNWIYIKVNVGLLD